MDRLLLELRIPSADVWYKLKSFIYEINRTVVSSDEDPVDPRKGSVAFVTLEPDICFTLEQVALDYLKRRRSDYGLMTS